MKNSNSSEKKKRRIWRECEDWVVSTGPRYCMTHEKHKRTQNPSMERVEEEKWGRGRVDQLGKSKNQEPPIEVYENGTQFMIRVFIVTRGKGLWSNKMQVKKLLWLRTSRKLVYPWFMFMIHLQLILHFDNWKFTLSVSGNLFIETVYTFCFSSAR